MSGARVWLSAAGFAAVFCLAVGALLWHPVDIGVPVRWLGRDVHSLLPRHRRFEPRIPLSAYAPLRNTPPDAARSNAPASEDVETWTAIRNLERYAHALGGGAAATSAALGLAALYRGDADAAVEMLGDATYLEPGIASYWCDLAAASLVRARPTDLIAALDAAEESLRLEPTLEPAAFDRALALEQLGLLDAAHEDWQTLQQTSRDAGWKAEARDHAGRAERQIAVIQTPVTADEVLHAPADQLHTFAVRALGDLRRMTEEELMPRLGAACAEGRTWDCADAATQIHAIGAAAAQASPDGELPSLAADVAKWTPGDLANAKRAGGLVEYGKAARLFQQDNVKQSVEMMARLAAPGSLLPSAMRANAAQYACIDLYLRSDHGRARACFDALAADAARDRLMFLQGTIASNLATVSLTEGNIDRASGEFDRSIALYADARDTNLVAITEAGRALVLDQLGSLDAAARDRASAMTNARLSARRRHTTLNGGARSAVVQHLFRAALVFEQAAVRNATAWGQPGALVESLLNRAVVYQRLGQTKAALADLDAARAQFQQISDSRAHARLEGELAVMEGEILSESTPAAAIRTLQKASDALTSMQFDMMRARVEYARGVAEERIGNRSDARAAFGRGVDVIERQRDPLAASAQMQSVDLVWDMYERLFTRRLEDEGNEAAFASAEAGRARVLRRALPEGAPDLPPLKDIPALLPPNAALLYFVVTETKRCAGW